MIYTEILEQKMIKLAQEYAFDYFNLDNNDERIPKYQKKRELIQNTLLKMEKEERLIIAFTFLFPENLTKLKAYYDSEIYEDKKNLALISFFRCLKD